jgi:hypothetical protein
LLDPTASETVSGRSDSIPPLVAGTGPAAGGELDEAMPAQPLKEPAEPLRIRGRCLVAAAHMAERDRCAASKASCVLSICSAMVIGTAGLFDLRGRLPVIATQMMVIPCSL